MIAIFRGIDDEKECVEMHILIRHQTNAALKHMRETNSVQPCYS